MFEPNPNAILYYFRRGRGKSKEEKIYSAQELENRLNEMGVNKYVFFINGYYSSPDDFHIGFWTPDNIQGMTSNFKYFSKPLKRLWGIEGKTISDEDLKKALKMTTFQRAVLFANL